MFLNGQKGLSMVELMISLLLGSLLSSMVLHIFFASKRHFMYVQQKIEMLMDQQLAIQSLRQSLFLAGFTPYGSIESLQAMENTPQPFLDRAVYLMPSGIMMHYMAHPFYHGDSTTDRCIRLQQITTLKTGDTMLLCNAKYFQINTITSINSHNTLSEVCFLSPIRFSGDKTITLGRWIEERYSIEHHKALPRLRYQTGHHSETLLYGWTSFTVQEIGKIARGVKITIQTQQQTLLTIMSRLPNA
jgi:prepilin-type N-terminal cleavage/methylation domain-containing protein